MHSRLYLLCKILGYSNSRNNIIVYDIITRMITLNEIYV